MTFRLTLFISASILLFGNPKWNKPRLIAEETDKMGIMERPGDIFDWPVQEEIVPEISEKVRMVNAPLLEISSIEIREKAAYWKHYGYYFGDAVYRLIQKNNIIKIFQTD